MKRSISSSPRIPCSCGIGRLRLVVFRGSFRLLLWAFLDEDMVNFTPLLALYTARNWAQVEPMSAEIVERYRDSDSGRFASPSWSGIAGGTFGLHARTIAELGLSPCRACMPNTGSFKRMPLFGRSSLCRLSVSAACGSPEGPGPGAVLSGSVTALHESPHRSSTVSSGSFQMSTRAAQCSPQAKEPSRRRMKAAVQQYVAHVWPVPLGLSLN